MFAHCVLRLTFVGEGDGGGVGTGVGLFVGLFVGWGVGVFEGRGEGAYRTNVVRKELNKLSAKNHPYI